jgi:hypothetical protein
MARTRKQNKSLSNKVSKLTRKVNQMVGSTEQKVHEYTVHYNISTAEQKLWLVDQITEGTAIGQRIGDEITLKNISLNLRVGIDPTALSPDSINNIRFLLVKTQWIGGSATMDAFLEDTSTGNFMMSPYKINPPFKYKVILDKKFTNLGYQLSYASGSPAALTSVPKTLYRSYNINTKNHTQKYEPGTSDLREESYVLFIKSDSNVVSHPRIDMYVRARYTDL